MQFLRGIPSTENGYVFWREQKKNYYIIKKKMHQINRLHKVPNRLFIHKIQNASQKM